MRVVKNINNNVAICIDNDGNEVVAFGKGLGFKKPPYDIELSQIERTFYDIDNKYISLLNTIDIEYFITAGKIADLARLKLNVQISSNIVFTLADHISFCIQRYHDGIVIQIPTFYDIRHLYEDEFEIGQEALQIINTDFKIHLPEREIASIAIHIINSEYSSNNQKEEDDNSEVIYEIAKYIEQFFEITINEQGFNYSRFITHMKYLLKRSMRGRSISSENQVMYSKMIETYPNTHACVLAINEIIFQHYHTYLCDEELLYLMLHINRLCSREDCYQ